MRQMRFAIDAQQFAIGINYACRIVVNARSGFFINRHYQHHRILFRQLAHQVHGRAGYCLGGVVPLAVLHLAEIWPKENFLQTGDLRSLFGRLLDIVDVFLDHCLFATGVFGLD